MWNVMGLNMIARLLSAFLVVLVIFVLIRVLLCCAVLPCSTLPYSTSTSRILLLLLASQLSQTTHSHVMHTTTPTAVIQYFPTRSPVVPLLP